MIQKGEALNVILTAIVLSGDVVVMSDMVGIAATSGAIGDEIAVSVEGVFALPKAAGTALAQGKRVYWDATALAVVAVATAPNVQVGYVAYAAAAAALTVSVTLIPA